MNAPVRVLDIRAFSRAAFESGARVRPCQALAVFVVFVPLRRLQGMQAENKLHKRLVPPLALQRECSTSQAALLPGLP
mgnify:CR=1 FL=1|jgi:hypothetical protein